MRGTGGIAREERTRLIKGDIPRDTNTTSDRVPTTIALTLRVIAKKSTLNGLGSELCPLTRLKQDKNNTTESMKMTILWRTTKETLKRSGTLKSSRGLKVHEEDISRDSFSPKLRRSGGGQ